MHYRHGRKEQPAACRLEKTPGGCDLIKKQTNANQGGGGGGVLSSPQWLCPPTPTKELKAGLSLAPEKKRNSWRTPARLRFNSAPAAQEILSVTGQPALVDHQPPSVTCPSRKQKVYLIPRGPPCLNPQAGQGVECDGGYPTPPGSRTGPPRPPCSSGPRHRSPPT